MSHVLLEIVLGGFGHASGPFYGAENRRRESLKSDRAARRAIFYTHWECCHPDLMVNVDLQIKSSNVFQFIARKA